MRRFCLVVGLMAMAALGWADAASASKSSGAGYTLNGDAGLVSPGDKSHTAVQLSSLGAGDYGLVSFSVPSGMTLSQLNKLATDYEFSLGSCWQGSPRFDVGVDDPSNAGAELHFVPSEPSTGCPFGTWATTGNLASPTSPVDAGEVGGSYNEPYASVQASYGSDPVTGIELVVDGYAGGSQTVEADNTQVNNRRYTYEK